MTFTVTATEGGAGGVSIAASLVVVSGQSGTGATATASALSASITPNATGSLIFGSVLATPGAFTGVSGTTIIQDQTDTGLEYGSVRSTSTTTGGTPETVGVTSSGGTGITTSLLEITTSGTLSISPSTPPGSGLGGTSVTSPAIAPPAGSMLVLMVQSNGTAGVATVAVTDTSGLGLHWTESVKDNGSGLGYTGVWTAVIPNNVPSTLFGQISGGGLASDSGSYTLGMQFTLSQSATLTGIWFFSPASATNLPIFTAIYQVGPDTIVSGSQNLSATWSGAAGSGWVKCAYASGPVLLPSTNYKVCVYKDSNTLEYSSTSHYWDTTGPGTAGLTSGIITAPNNAGSDGGQDTFTVAGGALVYPSSSFNATNYWVDVEVTEIAVQPGTGPAYTASMSSM